MNNIRKKSGMIGNILLGFFFMNISCAQASELHIAVASNFILPFKELSKKFQDSTGKKILLISGSTGKLYAQIIHGAPFDIFLAADSFRPKLLEKEVNEGKLKLISRDIYDIDPEKDVSFKFDIILLKDANRHPIILT